MRPPGALLAGIAIVLVVVGAYSNSLQGPFIFDDPRAIVQNPTIRRLWPIWTPLSPPPATTVEGRPITNLSLAVNYALDGTEVRGYHAMNLAVHVLAALALFGIVRRTLRQAVFAGRFAGAATPLALAIAVLWAVHPLQTECVTYIIQRAESIVGLFYLLTLYCVIRGAASKVPPLWHLAAVAACALGMGSKELMVSAPLMVLLYDRLFLARSFREVFGRRWMVYAALGATWGILAALMISAGGHPGSAGLGYGVNSLDYAKAQFGAVVHYLRLSLWPDRLLLDYGLDLAPWWAQLIPCAALIGLLLVGTVLSFAYRGWIAFLGVWFFATLAPSSSFIPIVTQPVAEHRMYLPLAAVVTGAVAAGYWVLADLLPRLARSQETRKLLRGFLPAALLVAVAAALGYRTFLRNEDYRTAVSIMGDNVAQRPYNARAHCALGEALLDAGDVPRAMEEFNTAIGIDSPYLHRAYNDRGNAYQRLGLFERAVLDHTKAIEINPTFAAAHDARGYAFRMLGRTEDALRDFTRAIELRPDFAEAYADRAVLHQRAGRYEQSMSDFARAIELKPDSPELYVNRGLAYQYFRQYEKAAGDFTRAIEMKADFAEAYHHRGFTYLRLGLFEPACRDFTRAINIRPDFAEAYNNRGYASALLGRPEQGVRDCTVAIGLRPDFADAYNNRGYAYALLRKRDEAIRDFTKAVETKPDLAEAYRNRAATYLSKQEYDKAWEDARMCGKLGAPPDEQFLKALRDASGRSE